MKPERAENSGQLKPPLQVTLADIEQARQRISNVIQPTPLAYSEYFSTLWGGKIYFKFENLLLTGSFKERGALNKLLCLSEQERSRGVITASAGNHGRAVAWHASRLGIPATVVMPVNSPIVKVQNTAATGARVVLHGGSFDEAVEHAQGLCHTEGLTYVHGFDDPLIVAGQGTIGLELTEQCPYLDMVVIPVGGGGLAAGIAIAMKTVNPRVHIVGVQSEDVPSMKVALAQQKPVTVPAHYTIADGIAVRRVGGLPLAIFNEYVDEIVTVNESEIANAILLLLEREKSLVEGAGAVGVAAIHNRHVDVTGKRVAVILSGGNIDVNILSRIIDKGLVKDGRLVKFHVVVPDYPGQLARILSVVAELRGNVLEVSHSRAFSEAKIGETAIDLVIETRGPDHVAEIEQALVAHGFSPERRTQ
ncbi:MAG: threonine ammonia-lyase [Candidatus Sumerlaea chitinivorans]|nr:threonine ammonia-lyase [Candidatus Sumerlaea chitinivorans]